MRIAWKLVLFILISFFTESILIVVLFQPEYFSTQELPEGFSFAQGVFHIGWLSVTFILLHKLFDLKKWTPGCSAYVVLFSMGGVIVYQLDIHDVNTGFMAIFAVSWIIFTTYISNVVDKKSKAEIQTKQ